MTLIEPDYGIHIEYNVKETQKYTYTEYVDKNTEVVYEYVDGDVYAMEWKPRSNLSYNEYNESVNAYFFWGKVPAEYQQ